MKKIFLLFSAIFISVAMSTSVYCAGNDIRIGLERSYKNVSQISVNDSEIRVGTGENNKYRINLGTYVIKPVGNTYYNIEDYRPTYEQAAALLPQYTGYSCIPALTDNGWTVYIRADSGKLDKPVVKTGAYCVGFAVNGKYKFIADGSAPCRIMAEDGIINMENGSYRGDIEFYRQGSVITAVNILPIDKYLYGVVTSEMPSSWNTEALKAQAVAARTYAEKNRSRHSEYNLCDTVHCQAYYGVQKESESGIGAVDETSGKEMYYNDELIDAVYFSSDGGATFNSEEVWSSPAPYLKAVKDIYEKESRDWTRTFTYSELTNICAANGYGIGNVISIEAEYTDEGLVSSLTFKGSKGNKTIYKDEIRSAFHTSGEGSLLSRNFRIIGGTRTEGDKVYVIGTDGQNTKDYTVISATNGDGKQGRIGSKFVIMDDTDSETVVASVETVGTPGTITFEGKGYGHCVGMSQYGAKAMAEEGHGYEDILNFYYKDIEIK